MDPIVSMLVRRAVEALALWMVTGGVLPDGHKAQFVDGLVQVCGFLIWASLIVRSYVVKRNDGKALAIAAAAPYPMPVEEAKALAKQ